jgi:hypothetical protein
MTPLFTKLNYKAQRPILALDAPESFEAELAALGDVPVVREAAAAPEVAFMIAFVTRLAQVEAASAVAAARAPGDAIVWLAYPKSSSKRYSCEFNRDTGWASMGAAGFEPVRQVAIDADWSALRFRRVEFIKQLTRNPKMRLT